MVSRENINYKAQQNAKYVPHYGIRKLSIGVASVLLGTVFYMQNGTVHADVNLTVSAGNDSVNVVNKDSGTSGSPVASSTSTGVSSANSAGSMVSTDDATNSTSPSQALGSSSEGATKQANNTVLVASEPESAMPASQVNVGTDNSNAISSLPPASHHQPRAVVGNQSNKRLSDNLSLSVNQKLNVNNSSLLASKVALTGISNQRFAGLQQSLAQNNQENVAKNVQGDWLWSGSVVPNDHVIDNVIGDDIHRMGVNFSFDLDGSQFKVGMPISIAKIVQTSNNHGLSTFDYESVTSDVYLHGQKIGYIRVDPVGIYAARDANGYTFSELDYRLFVTNSDLHFTGTQHLNFHVGWLGTLNYHGAWSFRGVKDSMIMYHLLGDGLDKTYQVHYQWPSVKVTKDANYVFSDSPAAGSYLTDAGWTNPGIWVDNPILEDADSMQLSLFHNSYGKQGSFSLNRNYRAGLRIRADQGNSILYPNSSSFIGVESEFPLMDSDGNMILTDLHAWNFVDFWQDNLNVSYPQKVYRDGLSLKQLEDLNFQGLSVSKQTDGSLLEYFNLPMSMLKVDLDLSKISDGTIWNVANISPYINYVAKSDQDAYNIAKNMIQAWSNSPMQGTPIQLYMTGNEVLVSDPSAHPNVYADLLDLNTGNVLQKSVEPGNYSTVISHGQSTVKLHVISTSGVDLTSVKSFTDWPDQNKHASLSVPSITGYHLVSNSSQVLSDLHLSGTAVSSSIQASYPAENTIADYYVVMAPDTESVKVNIVDSDEGTTLNSYTLSGDYGSLIMPTSDLSTRLESLLSSGKYDLVTNPLTDSLKYLTTNSPITISLKHHLDSTQRHYRVIEDLPDGTKKVIIDVEVTLYKDANVDAYQSHGAYVSGTNKLLKKNDIKILVGQDYGALHASSTWNDPTDDHFCSEVDVVPGYSYQLVDQMWSYQDAVRFWWNGWEKTVDLDIFNGDVASRDGSTSPDPLSSRDFHVIYTKNQYPVIINYYDTAGKLVNSVTSTHKFGDTVSIAPVAPTNYVLVSGQAKTDYLMRSGLNEVDFLVEPKLTTTAETKTVSRTIKVQTPDGQMNNVVQTVTFVRNSYLNQVTKQVTYSPWSFGGQYQFSGYLPKPMNGYTVDVIPAVIVMPDSLSTTVNVAYHQIHQMPVVYSVDYKLANGTVVKNVSVTPERDGMIHLTAPQGYRLLTTVTDVQVDHSSQKLTVLVLPDEQTYTAYSALPSVVTEPLTKTVTRTINITMPNGRVRRVVQQVHFVRTATVAANGKITYSNWTGVGQASFDRLFVPKRRGYRLVMTDNQDQTLIGVNQMVVDPMMNNVVINVKYVK